MQPDELPGRGSLSLRRILILGAALSILIPALALASFQVWYRFQEDLQLRVRTPLHQYAGVLERGMAVAIWNADSLVAGELADAVMGNPEVTYILVLDELGQPFVEKLRPNRPSSGLLREEVSIHRHGVALGKVVVEVSTARVRHLMLVDLGYQALALGVQVALSILLVWLLFDRRILRPLQSLQSGVLRFARGELDEPLRMERRDEIGQLAQSMDRMRTELADLIRERLRAEEELRASESQTRALIRAIPDLIFLNRWDGEFLAVHAADSKLLYPPERFLHFNISQVMPRPIADQFMAAYAEAFSSRAVQEVNYQLELEGQNRSFEARVVPCTEDSVLTIVRDVTEQEHAEAQRRSLEAQLFQSQKLEGLGSLAGGVAHDMNNVLGAILGLASAQLAQQTQGSSVHQAFELISKAAVRGGEMVKRLLSFARQSPAEEQVLDLNVLVNEVVHLLERTTQARIRLETDPGAGLGAIQGEASALTHALLNLCVNAMDAMPEGGTLTLRTRNVEDGWVEVLVQDTGSGMSREVLEKALDPFFTTKAQGQGTGLGLAIVYSTVKAHRGNLSLESEPGMGTRVRLRFPTCQAEPPAPPPPMVPPHPAAKSSLQVLLVDDDELIQSSIMAVLEMLGHRVFPAWKGEEALEYLDQGGSPDVVILDMNMPGIGGAETLRRLRAKRPSLPVFLSTGRADQAALDLADSYPLVTLLAKPFTIKELKERFDQLLQV